MKKRYFSEKMYYNGSENPPSRLDESKPVHVICLSPSCTDDTCREAVRPFCTVTYTITENKLRSSGRKIKGTSGGKLHYRCDFTLRLHMDITRMAFGVLFNGKDVGCVEAKYVDEVPRLDPVVRTSTKEWDI